MPKNLFEHFFIPLLTKYDIDQKDVEPTLNNWVMKHGNSDRSRADFIWSMMQAISVSIARKSSDEQKMYSNLRMIYIDMMEFLRFEKKSYSHILKLKHYCDLMTADDDTFKVNAEIVGMNDCTEAKEINGKVFSIEEARRIQILPYSNCTRRTKCVCAYVFSYVRDSDGKLIEK